MGEVVRGGPLSYEMLSHRKEEYEEGNRKKIRRKK